MNHVIKELPSSIMIEGKQVIQKPEEVDKMLLLASLGWGTKRIANELGCSRNTVKRYLRQGEWKAYGKPNRAHKLSELDVWLTERFKAHRGNADVVRQELKSDLGIDVSLRTVERAVAHLRSDLTSELLATVRFETAPGQQIQIDFGTKTLKINGEMIKVHVFVAVLGFSRRIYAQAFDHERQSAWFEGLDNAFRHFGGLTKQVLVDNAAALVSTHNRKTGELIFNERFLALCLYYGVSPRACAPYRARTKGKDERSVGYVKNNALAGRDFSSIDEVNAHLAQWIREIADVRIHGTTGEAPIVRFEREERLALVPLMGRAPFLQIREFVRRVANDSLIDVDTVRYSVPWRLIKEKVTVTVSNGMVLVHHAGDEVARHCQSFVRHSVVRDPRHFVGIFKRIELEDTVQIIAAPSPDLVRSLEVYEEIAGGLF